uniref:MAR-binding protein n=1 Tax=Solanum tuberosum TaxID=4113 RepID=M1BX26_SOLTU
MFTFFIYLLDWLVQKQVLKLKSFSKFEVENTSEALSEAMLLINSKPNKGLRKFLKAHWDGETLVVADSKLGNAIKEKLVSSLLMSIQQLYLICSCMFANRNK